MKLLLALAVLVALTGCAAAIANRNAQISANMIAEAHRRCDHAGYPEAKDPDMHKQCFLIQWGQQQGELQAREERMFRAGMAIQANQAAANAAQAARAQQAAQTQPTMVRPPITCTTIGIHTTCQ